MKTKIITIFILMVNSSLYAQWVLTGNAPTATNFLGTTNTEPLRLRTANTVTPQPIIFQTNGTLERMRIDAGGNVSIGGLTTPQSRLHINNATAINTFSQFTNSSTGSTATDGFQVGIGSTGNAELLQRENLPINFSTFGSQRMIIAAGGNVGIGTPTPTQLLQVTGGNIDVNMATNGYMINGSTVLSHGGNTTGIYLGVGAGSSSIGSSVIAIGFDACKLNTRNETIGIGYEAAKNNSGDFGTFVGYKSGIVNTGTYNSFFGHLSGTNNTSGQYNSFFGKDAGNGNTQGSYNSFLGYCAGHSNTTGYNNTYIGYASGFFGTTSATSYQNTFLGSRTGFFSTGYQNTFIGEQVGYNHTAGYQNTFIGYLAGNTNTTGNNNTYLGHNSRAIGTNAASLTNATAIGANAQVSANNSMVLGNNVNVGIGTTAPANKLEINQGTLGNSGLTLTQLTSAATPVTNPGNGVLSVNHSGDVVYVTGNNAPAIGNYCATGNPPNALTNNFAIPLNQFNYYFEGQGVAKTNVAIGMNCGDPLLFAKFSVLQSTTNPLLNPGISFAGSFKNVAGGNTASGIYSEVNGTAGSKVAGFFLSTGSGASHIGIYSEATFGSSTNRAAVFQGDVEFNGNVLGSQFSWTPSDARLKNNLKSIPDARSIIKALNPMSYYYDTVNAKGIFVPKEKQYGFIAQEVEAILPEFVREVQTSPKLDSLGNETMPSVRYKSLNYMGFISILTQALKDQQQTIDSLTTLVATNNAKIDSRLNDLESRLMACCGGGSQMRMANPNTEEDNASNQQVELNNLKAIVLEQNVPNPFAEQTTISYNIPTDAQSALMVFYDMNGRKIKETNVEKGAGNISVFAPNLSKGIYSYSLIVDGKVIETKKMIKGN